MAVNHAPFKILEINVSSAQDLPPVSKLLRTFTVAWIHPDQKLSTRIDHQGHNNPTWNYKLVFRVDDRFLRSETAVVTFEIYNVAWLRDLPIGTAYLFINHISPPLVQNSSVSRPVALYIRRPSGHLQGILNVGVTLINKDVSSSPYGGELSVLSFENEEIVVQNDDHQGLLRQHSRKDVVDEYKDEGKYEKVEENLQLLKQTSIKIVEEGKESKSEAKIMMKSKSFASTNPSMVTIMHPLPSEVAFHLKKGFYAPEGEEFGSSIFENWGEPTDPNSGKSLGSKSGKWRMEEDQILLKMIQNDDLKTNVKEGHKSSRNKRRSHSDGGGLCSCFGKGFEFTFAYGSKAAKKKIPRRELHVIHHDGKVQKFHV